MTTPPREAAEELSPEAVSGSWRRFLDVHEPLRPVLYRYCRSLTRSPWDADDLVQDTMARAFVTFACMNEAPPNPRAWLFRIASNLSIDRVRREREEPGPAPEETTSRGRASPGGDRVRPARRTRLRAGERPAHLLRGARTRPRHAARALHGGDPTIETSWGRVLPALARTRRVIAFDQQGHGRTADVDRPFTFEGSADDAAALLRHLKIAKADLMGFSNGATIAMQVAIRHPELVRRLVVASGMVKRDGLRHELWQGMQKARLEETPPHLVEAYRKTSPHPERLPSFFQKSVDRMLGFHDWPDAAVASIAAPTLVVIGDADIVRPEHAAETVRLLPHARLAVLPLADHEGVVFTRAGWLVPMVEAFLDEDIR